MLKKLIVLVLILTLVSVSVVSVSFASESGTMYVITDNGKTVNVRTAPSSSAEIIGRLPVLTYLNPLDRDALTKILTEPKNSIIKQYEKLFEMDGIKLTFTPEALTLIVDKAMEYKLGARGLRSIVESIMMDAMFEIPSKRTKSFEVTADYVQEQIAKSHLQ